MALLMEVEQDTDGRWLAEVASLPGVMTDGPLWDITRDGQRFVMVRESEGSGAKLVRMVNWLERWRSGGGSK